MRAIEAPFDLDVNGVTLKISEHELAGKRVFHVNYADGRKQLLITIAIGANDKKFWTSVPEGRQKEANDIGKLIAEYIRAKRK